ncbi:DUF6602 domain-containing protein [Gynuella sunshinyii]|uniref:DUF6602 domain-containing protein n=1 Tax=Gynuella sunshinyii YC6258 TaxID=1445510 RepID=A0A0C5V0Z9_9GAMM|nr:DUF6602 domain-containing protein [Gynuella sunshinyii]AJQ93190.1 hypothetical Protein YC6258_01142 [Gynuella sunshinyii YC6258]
MSDWKLSQLLESLHGDIQHRLKTVRQTIEHPTMKGDGSENVWIGLLNNYLPERYRSSRAFVVDSNGEFSEQMDVVIYDRQYSPLVFHYEEQLIIPAESVYAVFEVKQTFDKGHIDAAHKKVASVRKLYRTSMDIVHAGGISKSRTPFSIIGGILALECDLKELETTLKGYLMGADRNDESKWLTSGCAANRCFFYHDKEHHDIKISQHPKATTAFLFQLLSQLQSCGTVPMLDIHAYGKWLE